MLGPPVHAPSTSLGFLLLSPTHFLFLLDFISSSVSSYSPPPLLLFFFFLPPCLGAFIHHLPRITLHQPPPQCADFARSFRGWMGCLVSAKSPLFPGLTENSIALIQNPVHLNSCLDNTFQFSRLSILPLWRHLRGFALQNGKNLTVFLLNISGKLLWSLTGVTALPAPGTR